MRYAIEWPGLSAEEKRDGFIEKRTGTIKPERDEPFLVLSHHLGDEMADEADRIDLPEDNPVALFEPFARLGEGLPSAIIEPFDQQSLNRNSVFLARPYAHQPRGDHLGVVENEEIAGCERIRQIRKAMIRKFGRPARFDHQKARGIARARGVQRDPLFGEMKIVIRERVHGGSKRHGRAKARPLVQVLAPRSSRG